MDLVPPAFPGERFVLGKGLPHGHCGTLSSCSQGMPVVSGNNRLTVTSQASPAGCPPWSHPWDWSGFMEWELPLNTNTNTVRMWHFHRAVQETAASTVDPQLELRYLKVGSECG